MTDLKIGDKVVMRDLNENRANGPREGIVVKVGRKLVTAAPIGYEGNKWCHVVYRLETMQANDAYGHGWLQTPEQYALGERRSAVLVELRQFGIECRAGAPKVSLDKLERLLAVLKEPE